MKHCWSDGKTMGGRIGPVVIISIVILGPKFIRELHASGYYPPILLFLIFAVYYGLFTSWVSERKYEISPEGIYIKFPFKAKQLHRWSEFSEIALCKVHYAQQSDFHRAAIRCVIGREEGGPKRARKANEKWAFASYEYRKYKQIISIYYTEERYEEFRALCPLPIKDYRHLRYVP